MIGKSVWCWCHQISVYISVSRHVQTTWRRRRREEEREYSIFSTFLLWKHTFDRFTITNGYAHLSLFTYVLDKIKTEFATNHHADCNICRVNIPTSHLSLLDNAPLLGYIIQKRMTVYWNIFTSIDDLAHYIIGVAFIFTTTRNINTIPVIHSPVCLFVIFCWNGMSIVIYVKTRQISTNHRFL